MSLIQSITIPTTTLRDGVIYYNISIITTTSAFSIQHRYNDFASLHSSLARELAKPPPSLPPSSKSWYSISKTLNNQEIEERRLGLQTFLKAIIIHKDSAYANSRSIKKFLAPTEEITELNSKITSQSWLSNFSTLQALARETIGLFNKRDSLRSQHSAESHAINLQGKKSLVELITGLENLTLGLKELEKSGMMQGEVERRRNLIETLQVEVEKMGQLATSTTAVASTSSTRTAGVEPTPSNERKALFSTKPAGRILGIGSATAETAATRPLDNGGLLQLQQTYMDSQDSKLDSLTVLLRRQRVLGEMISTELSEQGEIINGLEQKSDKVTKSLGTANKTMKKLGK